MHIDLISPRPRDKNSCSKKGRIPYWNSSPFFLVASLDTFYLVNNLSGYKNRLTVKPKLQILQSPQYNPINLASLNLTPSNKQKKLTGFSNLA